MVDIVMESVGREGSFIFLAEGKQVERVGGLDDSPDLADTV